MIRFPLRYARRNVLVGPDGEAAALYRADTVAFPFLPNVEKWGLLRRLERFAHLAGADFSIWRVQREYPAERYAPDLADLADGPFHEQAGTSLHTVGFMREVGDAFGFLLLEKSEHMMHDLPMFRIDGLDLDRAHPARFLEAGLTDGPEPFVLRAGRHGEGPGADHDVRRAKLVGVLPAVRVGELRLGRQVGRAA